VGLRRFPRAVAAGKTKEDDMSKENETEIFSRRKFMSILGLATLALTVPSTALLVSKAEAQAPSTPPASQTGSTAAPQTGRQQRRLASVKRASNDVKHGVAPARRPPSSSVAHAWPLTPQSSAAAG
jgi:hypothetical protein